nr:MAG TPA: hypothetical protein [Caudoviricetes sp.]
MGKHIEDRYSRKLAEKEHKKSKKYNSQNRFENLRVKNYKYKKKNMEDEW